MRTKKFRNCFEITLKGAIVGSDTYVDTCMPLNGVCWEQPCLACSTLPSFGILFGMDDINGMGGNRISKDVFFPPHMRLLLLL